MLGYFVANGTSSADYNIYLTDAGIYGIAERDVTTVSVPGRNGDLIFDNNRYKNIGFSYPCIIRDNFSTHFSAFVNFLISQKGYIKIEDSFMPEIYVLARYAGETNPAKVVTRGRDGVFDLVFDRKPQRFLKEGLKSITMASGGAIKNPFETDALPIVRVYGTGSVSINGLTIRVNSANEYTDIDCATQNAYKGSVNCNANITLEDGEFFKLTSGINQITLNGVSRIVITPNWWIL